MIQTRVKRVARNKAWASSLLVAALMAVMLLAARPAHAATFTVDRNDDPDPATAKACTAAASDCSLRGAIVAANAAAGADAITVPAGTYTLTRTDLVVTGELTITGAGARATSVVGGAAPFNDRIFHIQPDATATISGLTIRDGKASSSGGGIYNSIGTLTLINSTVSGNSALDGGGIFNYEGTLTLTNSTVSENTAAAAGGGGGIFSYDGTVTLTNSTVSGNSGGVGGGSVNSEGTLTLTNSTVSGNAAAKVGGVFNEGGTVPLTNTIIARNSADTNPDAQGTFSSQGHNLIGDTTGATGFVASDLKNVNPRLGPLKNNGGPTDTHALLAGSPAIDAGTNTGCPTTDQRGVKRPQGLRCDIGAFERPNSAPLARNDSYRGAEDKVLKVPARGVLRNDTDADGNPLAARRVSGPRHGKLTLRANGSFTYKPKKDFNGTVRFVYRASDGRGGSDKATVTLRIKPRQG